MTGDSHTQPDCAALLALADEYESGLSKALATGYEEYGPNFEQRHRMVINALRFQARATPAQPAGMREALEWIADQRDTNGLRVSDICTVADRALAVLPAERPAVAGFTEAEGYASSLRQQARWIEESPAAEMIDADELRSAANFIERMHGNAQAAPEPAAWVAEYDGHLDTTIYRDTMERWKALGRKITPLYASPVSSTVREGGK